MSFIFFFNDTATTEIYTLSLHDALPICERAAVHVEPGDIDLADRLLAAEPALRERPRRHHLEHAQHLRRERLRSEEHTSELQSRQYLVCRLLLEKKNISNISYTSCSLRR